jgi:kinesin family protein C1
MQRIQCWLPNLAQCWLCWCWCWRAVVQVFESSRFLGKQGWRFAMQASMLEIYNEEYKDLLARKQKLPDGKAHKVGSDMPHTVHTALSHSLGCPSPACCTA